MGDAIGPIAAVAIGVFGIILAGLWIAHAEERHQASLIESGNCTVDMSSLYQPPPVFVCVASDGKGMCNLMVPVQGEPYIRNHWKCRNGDDFWRKQQ